MDITVCVYLPFKVSAQCFNDWLWTPRHKPNTHREYQHRAQSFSVSYSPQVGVCNTACKLTNASGLSHKWSSDLLQAAAELHDKIPQFWTRAVISGFQRTLQYTYCPFLYLFLCVCSTLYIFLLIPDWHLLASLQLFDLSRHMAVCHRKKFVRDSPLVTVCFCF